MKTISCPSCGASATNHQNCEFCGSLFVRYIDKGISLDKVMSDNVFSGEILPGLEDYLKDTILRQNAFVKEHEKFISGEFIATSIGHNSEDYAVLVGNVGTHSDFSGKRWIENGLGVFLQFSADDEYKGKSGLFYLEKFKELDEFDLFNDVTQDDACKAYWIDYGNDITGAAYISSKIAKMVYGISPSNCFIDIWDSSSPENHKNGGGCFIATATMGDYDHPDVVRLRKFRDAWILKQTWGSDFVKWYYKNGQKPAEIIRDNKLLKLISYLFIVKPLLVLSRIFGN